MFLLYEKRGCVSRSPVFLAMVVSILGSRGWAGEIDLTPREHAKSLIRVKTVVEVAGSLIVGGSKPEVSRSIPMKVNAELFYDERGIAGDLFPSVRHFWRAKADFEIGESKDSRQLRERRQLILLSGGSVARHRYTSPLGLLTREELELIDVPANGFPPERLLPGRIVQEQETWIHEADVAAELLRLGRVTSGELQSRVKQIASDVVQIEITGEVSGEVEGVQTELRVRGKYHFDRKAKFVSWIALAIRENRSVGFAAPGFEVTARVRTARQPLDRSEALSQPVLGNLELGADESDKLLEFVSADNSLEMALERRWHPISSAGTSATFRMVDGGTLLATYKMDELPQGVPGQYVSLEEFRADVERALDKHCEEIAELSETVSPHGNRVLRVVAKGEVAQTPIHWIYYHLSDDAGRRLSCIFTHESSLESRFAGMDQSLTASIRFLDQKNGTGLANY